MSIELQPNMRQCLNGVIVEWPEWWVVVDGKRVALLPHTVDSTIMPHSVDFPVDRMDEICEACAKLRKEIDGQDSVVKPAPEYQTRYIDVYKELVVRQEALYEEEEEDE